MKPHFARQPHIRLAVPAAALLCVLLALLAGQFPASASQAPTAARLTLRLTMSHVGVQPAAPGASTPGPAVTVPCSPGLNKFTRFDLCYDSLLTFTFINGTTPVGQTQATLVQFSALSGSRTSWTEFDTFSHVASEGTTEPITITLDGTCGQCSSTSDVGGTLKTGLKGTMTFSVSLAGGHQYGAAISYTLVYSAPKFLPLTIGSSTSPLSFRCDNGVAAAGEGCVYPRDTPTLALAVKQAGASAAMFKWAQVHMTAHWGLQGKGKPLTRASGATGDANRGVVCDGTFRPISGIGAPAPGTKNPWTDKDSCDEFPYASTAQSGAPTLKKEKKTGAACAQLRAVRTSNSGNEAQQWGNVTVIGTANAAAPCVRGHIPLRQNSSTGGSYTTFIKNQRLFVGENFWVSVT